MECCSAISQDGSCQVWIHVGLWLFLRLAKLHDGALNALTNVTGQCEIKHWGFSLVTSWRWVFVLHISGAMKQRHMQPRRGDMAHGGKSSSNSAYSCTILGIQMSLPNTFANAGMWEMRHSGWNLGGACQIAGPTVFSTHWVQIHILWNILEPVAAGNLLPSLSNSSWQGSSKGVEVFQWHASNIPSFYIVTQPFGRTK